MPPKSLTIALAGNPNSGKTTIFNNITGTRQKVGNWPGVTVEKKEGSLRKHGYDLKIIDLPGTYSLTPYSIEEIVARNFVLDENPDVVIDIIDASNYLSAKFSTPSWTSYAKGWMKAAWRARQKRRNGLVAGSKNSMAYERHRFPGISLDDVSQRIR